MSRSDTPDPTTELTPFTEQRPFLQDNKKYQGYISGVGAGKTFAGILRTILNVERWNPGEMGAIVAPTTTMVLDVIVSEMRDIGLTDHWEYRSQYAEDPGLHAPNGSRVLFLSADNRKVIERLRGLNLAWFWMDEAAVIDKRAREILTQRIRVGDYRNGFFTSTPKGKNHLYDFFVGDIDGEEHEHGQATIYEGDDRLSVLKVPSHANPHNPQDYIDSLEHDHSGQRYEQEVLGSFVNFEGLVYPWFDEENIDAVEDLPDTFEETIYGLDWGGSAPTAIACLRRSGDEWYVTREFYERRVVNDTIIEELERMHDEATPGPIYCDTNEPRAIEELNREGFDAREAEKSVETGIRHVDSLRDRLYVVEDCQHTINEFNQYRYKDGADTVLKENDHLMDSVRYALFTNDTALDAGGFVIA